MNLRRESSTETAARFLRLYRSRLGRDPSDHYRRPRREHPTDTATFREIVLAHVWRAPRSAIDIQRAVVDDYGSHQMRRFWRALQFWIAVGRVERHEGGYRRTSSRRAGGPA